MTKSPMLLVQPLKIEDINIHIKEDDDTQQQQQPSSNEIPQVSPIVDMIDDAELLAILGIPPITTNATTSPVSIEDCLLDWDNMPELLSDESESVASTTNTKKRKHDDELFVLLDFEEYQPIMSSKKSCLTPNSNQEPQVESATTCQQDH